MEEVRGGGVDLGRKGGAVYVEIAVADGGSPMTTCTGSREVAVAEKAPGRAPRRVARDFR